MQIGALLQQALQILPNSPAPRLDVEVLLAHLLTVSRHYLYTYPERTLTAEEFAAWQQLLARRQQGEPMAYILGQREFWSMDLTISPATLIPRPETEHLVEQTLARIPLNAVWQIADLGTGSGAIALAIAKERPLAQIYAVDKSIAALQIAKLNTLRLQTNNVYCLAADWLTAFRPASLDVIVSNPPYLAASDRHLTEGDVRFEPRTALVAGEDGLEDYRTIIAQAKLVLKSSGHLLLEHGCDQASSIVQLLQQQGFIVINRYQDLAGLARIVCAQKVDETA